MSHIIKGNHDRDQMKYVKEMVVDIRDYAELTINNQKICMSHYPMLSWNKGHYGSWMLHGHTHGSVNYMDRETTRLDVGVDNFAFAPIEFEDIKEIMRHRKYLVVDHHHNPYEVTNEYE